MSAFSVLLVQSASQLGYASIHVLVTLIHHTPPHILQSVEL